MIRFTVRLFLLFSGSLCLGSELNTVSPNSIIDQEYSRNFTKDGLTKRGIENVATAKSYDPPPEFYRGPTSTSSSSSSSSYKGNSDKTGQYGYSSRPVAFPDQSYSHKGGSSGSWDNKVADTGTANLQERKGLHDRLSVGHYNSGSSHSGYGSGNHGYGASTTAYPYGPPQAIEYEYYSPTGNGHGYSEGGADIPVELYNRGYGGYGHGTGHGAGHGDYSTYTVATGHGGGPGHGGGGYPSEKHGYDKALLAKSFLIPLASAAVLGIAAALASNPLLLQLGTVSGIGKRRRRDLRERLVHSVAYRGQRRI